MTHLGHPGIERFVGAWPFRPSCRPTSPGSYGSLISALADANGDWLDGSRDYTLHVPPNPPAKLFWNVTVYSVSTRCLIDNEQQRSRPRLPQPRATGQRRRLGRSRLSEPSRLEATETNWIQTIPERALVLLLPPLRATRSVLRPQLEARRHHPRLTDPAEVCSRRQLGHRGSGFGPVAVTSRCGTQSSTWLKPSKRAPWRMTPSYKERR